MDRGRQHAGSLEMSGQQIAHPDRIDAIHRGMCAADPSVERGERIQHPPAGGSQRSCQRMDS